jgi:hypothetical protein
VEGEAAVLISRDMPLTAEIDALGSRKRKAVQPSEAMVQRAIIQRFQLSGILCVHVPNEGKRSMAGHMQAKRDGMMVGFPDLLLYAPGGRHGLLEIKKPGWKAPREPKTGTAPTSAWKAWAARLTVYEALTSRGHPVAVVTSVDEAVAAVKRWGFL